MGLLELMASGAPTEQGFNTMPTNNVASRPAPEDRSAEADVFMRYAQKAAMLGLNEHADNFLSIAKTMKAGSAEKEFNVPGDVDTFLMQTSAHGADYTTPQGRIAARKYLATPQGSKEFSDWKKAFTAKENTGILRETGYMDSNRQPIFVMTRPSSRNPAEFEPVYVSSSGVSSKLPDDAYSSKGLNAKDEEALVGYSKAMNFMDDMKSTLAKVSTGFPKVGEAKTALNRYLSKEDAIKFNAARDQMKNEAQSLIKGIPSNFDVENFIKVLPNADYSYADNKERIRQMENMIRQGLRSKVSNLRKQRMPIPDDIQDMMKKYGVGSGSAVKDDYTGSVQNGGGAEKRPSGVPADWKLVEKNGKKGYVSPDGKRVIPVR